jgi:hypothetical protein
LSAEPGPDRASSRYGPPVLIGLLIASLALAVLVYRARTPDLALEVTSFPKTFREGELAEIEFFVRRADEDATVEIVGRDQVVVRTLADSISLSAEERVRCVWDGLDDEGQRAEAGRYRLRVTLPGEGREMVFPKRLDVKAGERGALAGTPRTPCETEGTP